MNDNPQKQRKEISRGSLYNWEAAGKLLRIMPGYFVDAGEQLSDENLMQWIYTRQPTAVMNLVSALAYHGLSTQIPAYLSVSLPRGQVMPRLFVSPVRVWYTKEEWHGYGVERQKGKHGEFQVTSPERTLVDCFRYRNKIGLDIFLEALRVGMQKQRYHLNTIAELSKIYNVAMLMKPYIKTIVA